MIVKKLNDVSGGGFPGARYNEKKIADGVATLMAMENVSEACATMSRRCTVSALMPRQKSRGI